MVVGTCCLQGRQPLPWGQVPCEFQADRSCFQFFREELRQGSWAALLLPRFMSVHHPWLAAPDVIWHIYSHLYSSSRDGGRDLPSSGEVALTMGKVPCEFWTDQNSFSSQQKSWDKGPSSLGPAQDGTSSMAGGSRHNLAHLLTPVQLLKGWW